MTGNLVQNFYDDTFTHWEAGSTVQLVFLRYIKFTVRNLVITALFSVVMVWPVAFALGQENDDTASHRKAPRVQVIKVVRPTYPDLAKQNQVEGKVSLFCVIATDGSVQKVEVKEGHPLLVQAAMDAVKQWKFKPLVVNGEAVEMETTVSLEFRLPKEEKPQAAKRQHQPN